MRPTVAASKELAERLFARLEADSPMGHTKMATLSQNQILNRWNNVLPYDTTRIKLASVNSDEDNNDYINASKVEAPFVDDKSYILTQGPLPETIGHFWSMVWQQQTSAVVMLCRLNESGICKCAHYWPSTQADDDLIRVADRGLEVRLRDLDDTDSDTLIRNLELRHCSTDTIRVITQYHYLTWPDFGVPSSTSTFLRFLQNVNSKHPSTSDSPNVIHCSAGIGRSGTFCLVDACLERMQRTKRPLSRLQIIESLVRMRAMRGGLVQTPDQLRFSLQAIEDAMKDIEFVEENGNGNADTNGSSLNNGSTTGNRKRSTDDIMDEEAVINNAENVANSAPKRPKANC